MHITTKVVSLNPTDGEVCSIQHYMWYKVCQWHVTVRWFSPGTPVSSTNKTDCHDITELLLKVVLNTITLTQMFFFYYFSTFVSKKEVMHCYRGGGGHVFLVNYTLNLSYIYPIFSCKKILYSYIIFVRNGLTPCMLHNVRSNWF